MKLFRFSDLHSPKNVFDSLVVEGEKLFYVINPTIEFKLRPAVAGFSVVYCNNKRKICLVTNHRKGDSLYSWEIESDSIELFYELPSDAEFYRMQDDVLVISNNDYSNTIFTITNTKTKEKSIIETGRGGSLIYSDNECACYINRSQQRLIAKDYSGNILWSKDIVKIGCSVNAWHNKKLLFVSEKVKSNYHFTVLDVRSGKERFSFSAMESPNLCRYDEVRFYIKTMNYLIIYDDKENIIVFDEFYNNGISDFGFYGEYLYLATSQPIDIHAYDKQTMNLLSSKSIGRVNGQGFLMATSESKHLLAIWPDAPEDKRGLTWIAYFTDNELFGDEWNEDVEAAYYHVEEQDDFSGGVSLKVTFDTDIDFDTLYRHVSTGLQTAAFRNGIHRFTEGKSHNERFNGTVIANFEDHVFSDEQKELIEDLCERTTKYFQEGMSLLSGDGSQLCHVTSIIPTTYTGT